MVTLTDFKLGVGLVIKAMNDWRLEVVMHCSWHLFSYIMEYDCQLTCVYI